jgi:hypothetical protein
METLVYLILANQEATIGLTSLVPELFTLLAIWFLMRAAGVKPIYFWLYVCAVATRFLVLFGQIIISNSDGAIAPFDPGIMLGLSLFVGYLAPLCLLFVAVKLLPAVSKRRTGAA